MRYQEISGGIKVQLTNEEANFIEALNEDMFDISNLKDEREQVIATNLLYKGVFKLQDESDLTKVKLNKIENIWRV